MSTETNLREGPVTTADARTSLATMGSNTTPGLIKTPSDKKRIAYLVVALGQETPTTTTGGGIAFVRLGGKALKEEVQFVIGGLTYQIATSGESGGPGFGISMAVDITLETPGEYLEVYAEVTGVEACDPNIMVTPVYE
jgi:hypothetical protein